MSWSCHGAVGPLVVEAYPEAIEGPWTACDPSAWHVPRPGSLDAGQDGDLPPMGGGPHIG